MSGTDRSEQRSQRTYDTDAATKAEDSQEVAEFYDASAEDYERRILSYVVIPAGQVRTKITNAPSWMLHYLV